MADDVLSYVGISKSNTNQPVAMMINGKMAVVSAKRYSINSKRIIGINPNNSMYIRIDEANNHLMVQNGSIFYILKYDTLELQASISLTTGYWEDRQAFAYDGENQFAYTLSVTSDSIINITKIDIVNKTQTTYSYNTNLPSDTLMHGRSFPISFLDFQAGKIIAFIGGGYSNVFGTYNILSIDPSSGEPAKVLGLTDMEWWGFGNDYRSLSTIYGIINGIVYSVVRPSFTLQRMETANFTNIGTKDIENPNITNGTMTGMAIVGSLNIAIVQINTSDRSYFVQYDATTWTIKSTFFFMGTYLGIMYKSGRTFYTCDNNLNLIEFSI